MTRTIALLLVLAGLASCRIGDAEVPPRGGIECDSGLEVPERFAPLETFREEAADHVGIRAGFVDGRGRELHLFAGIPGEFGEGLPPAGEVRLTRERIGLVSGSGRVWVLEWTQGGPCYPRAVLVNGLRRRGFLGLLREMGLAAGSG